MTDVKALVARLRSIVAPMTGEEEDAVLAAIAALEASPPAWREGLTDVVWLELQRSIASSGEEAKRLVMMGKDDLAYAIGRAFDTLPVRDDYARGFEAAREMAAKVAAEYPNELTRIAMTTEFEQQTARNAAQYIAHRIRSLKSGDAT